MLANYHALANLLYTLEKFSFESQTISRCSFDFYSHFCHLFCKELYFSSHFQSIWFKKWWVSRVTKEFHAWLHSLKVTIHPISLEMPIWGKTNTGLCFSFSKYSTCYLSSSTCLPVISYFVARVLFSFWDGL